MSAQLKTLFADLGYPGILKFKAAAKKAGIDAPFKTLRRIVEESSQRQVLGREPKYLGKIVSDMIHKRWAADLISYINRPTTDGFTHVLVVQDIFSRFVWTRALKSAQTKEVTEAFLEILREARDSAEDAGPLEGSARIKVPFELNSDKGSEFTGKEFQDMLVAQQIKFREKESKNDIATVDRAIATVKQTISKLEITPGAGEWAEVLQKATKAHNKKSHTHLDGGAPEDVQEDKEKQFDLQQQAAKSRDQQTEVSKKLRGKVEKNPTYRTVTPSVLNRLKDRAHKPKYDAELSQLDRIEGRYAIDTTGKKSLVSRIKSVPASSTTVAYGPGMQTGDPRLDATRRTATTTLRDRIAALLPPTGMMLGSITKKLTPDEKTLLATLKIDTRQFLELHDAFGETDKTFHNKRNYRPVKIEQID